MYCAKCGQPNDDNAYQCMSCGEVLMRADAAPPVDAQSDSLGPAPQTWLVPSILATIFCCLPAGVAGIVYGAMASSSNGIGDYIKAHEQARHAKTWFWVSFGVGFAFIAFYVVVAVLGAASGGSGGTWP